jgi:2-iminobutanoate/2-iminopropanoate deaminase
MNKKIISTELAPKAIGPYSQGVYSGGVYYFSGQIGLDPQTMEMKNSFKEQLDQVLKNIDALLAAENLKRMNIIKTTIFLTDLNNFNQVNEAYNLFFQAPYPARSTLGVKELPKGALVEIEVLAVN